MTAPFSALLYSLALTVICGALPAVQINSNALPNRALFKIEFPGETRDFIGKEASIHSIAKQEYITGAFRVIEVNIVTEGNALLRIYYSRPLRVGEAKAALDNAASGATGRAPPNFRSPLPEAVRKMAEQAGGTGEPVTGNTVIKEYPIATHAGTIEFRVRKRSEVLQLYEALINHWSKEPAFFEGGQIVSTDEATESEERPRSLGGTIFILEE